MIVSLTSTNSFQKAWVEIYESLAIELQTADEVNVVTALRGGETAEFEYQVRTSRRGYYRLGPIRITTGDVFGFISDQRAFSPPAISPFTPALPL